MKQWIFVLFGCIFLQGCKWWVIEESLPAVIAFKPPANFPPPIYPIGNNPVTTAGFNLGKALFYDNILSGNGTVSCASCHKQASSFAQQGFAFSQGINGQTMKRNTPALVNLAWNQAYYWAGDFPTLEQSVLAHITKATDMGDNLTNVVQKLQNSPTYPALFEQAFGSPTVTIANTSKALSQYLLMLISANSRYDKMRRGEGSLSAEENAGLNIFRTKCSMCHAGELFSDNSYANNGLPLAPSGNDRGRYNVTFLPQDDFRFRVPTLRNIEKTAPYMHDGRFATLAGVVSHYLNPSLTPNVDFRLRQMPLGGLGISMTADEQAKIIAFLHTLTDDDFLNNSLFKP